ncbi:recombinase family protein [Flavonifractor sp. An82]|uniref:recombinase family protein n=1 Tax=Flavonifractor sp. An82 TaxID=1965660 RepID=UPI000B36E98C|nr:recombinase family protein [Flavonifractor sp. An82]OUN23800.1 recombinase family protein [Flavonifractor sp. An82]
MTTLRELREQLRMGRSIYDLSLRVTYYARVSTEKVEQQGSLENQVQYYTEFIQKNPNWTFVQGYVDEGISGASTYKRESFLRMIDDAHRGLFDFIITKEISRFSRSTLDSIQYTQELLDANVGVLFQNDNINTLDTDSEFRLVVMAGVAQDEVRKLSERLKFGFRQSIKKGRVLGNNRLWGYDKKDCKLTIIPEQAEAVRLIFELYATGKYGIRRIARELTRRGHTSLLGNEFNQLTIKHILTNPKYKGWYCGNKTQSLDYRTKKKAFLEEHEWVMYPDPNIPAIVSEELWNRANAIFQQRSREVRTKATSYHNRYPYSGKIICGRHGTSFHRQSYKTLEGETEFWRCKTYRQQGRGGCSLPAIRTHEVDLVLADLFQKVVTEKKQIIRLVLDSIGETTCGADYAGQIGRIEVQISQIEEKKDKLLELSMADAITLQEFKERNGRLNRQISALEEQRMALRQREQMHKRAEVDQKVLEKALWEELNFTNGVRSEVVAAILDHIVVLEQSSDKQIYLEIYLRLGQQASAHFQRGGLVLCNSPLKNTIPPTETRTT